MQLVCQHLPLCTKDLSSLLKTRPFHLPLTSTVTLFKGSSGNRENFRSPYVPSTLDMPSKKGKKAGTGVGNKNKANPPKQEATHAGPSTTAQSGRTAVPQQVVNSTKVVPKPAAPDPLQPQANSVYEQDAESTRTSSESTLATLSLETVEPAAAAVMGSKGKERATVPAPVPNTSVSVLASRLRVLKTRAGLIENSAMSSSVPALRLNLSAADEDLKDRARRMEKIQQRTSAEYPDVASARKPMESFIEMLLAGLVANQLCRSYADVMYAEDDFFSIKYLWRDEPLWSVDEKHETTSDEQGLEEHESRWQGLTAALRQKPEYQRLKDAVDEDFVEIGKLLQKANVKSAVDQVFEHSEYAKFREGDSGGLIVHAYDPDYRKKCENQSRGLRKLWKGRLRDSVVSGFPHRFLTEFKGPGIAIMHAAGYVNTFRPRDHALARWRGLFRNLCNQLIAQRPYMKGLKLTRLTNDMLAELKKPRAEMEMMFELFHNLILDVAEMGLRRKWPVQEVVVIIDGIDWFEDRPDNSALPIFDAQTMVREYKNVVRENGRHSALAASHWASMTSTEQKFVQDWLNAEAKAEKPDTETLQDENSGLSRKSDMSWELVVEFFRNLADECNSSNLGMKVCFKYILLHPLSSRLGANPSVLERYITLDKDL